MKNKLTMIALLVLFSRIVIAETGSRNNIDVEPISYLDLQISGTDPFNSKDVGVEPISSIDRKFLNKYGDDAVVYDVDIRNLFRSELHVLKSVTTSDLEFYAFIDADLEVQVFAYGKNHISSINFLLVENEVRAPQSSSELCELARFIHKLWPQGAELGVQPIYLLMHTYEWKEWGFEGPDDFLNFKNSFYYPRFTLTYPVNEWEMNFLSYDFDESVKEWTVTGRVVESSGVLEILEIGIKEIHGPGAYTYPMGTKEGVGTEEGGS